VLLGLGGPPAHAETPVETHADGVTPFLTLRPQSGLYEGLTFTADGRSLALLRTDSASRTTLDLVELVPAARPVERFHLPPETAALESMVAFAEGSFAFLRSGDKEDARALTVIASDGKKRWEAGNLWQVGFPRKDEASNAAGARSIVLVQRTSAGGWSLTARDPVTGKAASKPRVFDLDGRGLLRGLGLKPISFFADFTRLLAERPGAYDKGKDSRLPSSAVMVEALTGKVLHEAPIEDRFGWALSSQLRAHAVPQGQAIFLRLADNGDASHVALELVDARGLIHPVTLPGNPRIYDRQTLVVEGVQASLNDQPHRDRLTFSLAVDPVNPEAVARKKADLAFLDVFELSTKDLPPGQSPHPGAPEAAPLPAVRRAHVALSDRPVTWLRDGDTLAVLRRFKSFARGGDQVDILRLAPLP
jgi:hypothetical protein